MVLLLAGGWGIILLPELPLLKQLALAFWTRVPKKSVYGGGRGMVLLLPSSSAERLSPELPLMDQLVSTIAFPWNQL